MVVEEVLAEISVSGGGGGGGAMRKSNIFEKGDQKLFKEWL